MQNLHLHFTDVQNLHLHNFLLKFFAGFIDGFNARFAVEAQDLALHWKNPPADCDFDFLFSVRAENKTRANGSFIYHGYKFNLLASNADWVSPNVAFCIKT